MNPSDVHSVADAALAAPPDAGSMRPDANSYAGFLAAENGTMGRSATAGGSGIGSGYGYGAGARRRDPAGPVVRAAPPQVSGPLSSEVIRRVVLRNLAQVTHCYEQGLAMNATLAGRVVIHFLIGRDGAVLVANVAQTTVPLPPVGLCIASAVRRLQFPAPDGGAVVQVDYPFTLQLPQ